MQYFAKFLPVVGVNAPLRLVMLKLWKIRNAFRVFFAILLVKRLCCEMHDIRKYSTFPLFLQLLATPNFADAGDAHLDVQHRQWAGDEALGV